MAGESERKVAIEELARLKKVSGNPGSGPGYHFCFPLPPRVSVLAAAAAEYH